MPGDVLERESPKDMEDARHIRNIAEKHVSEDKINEYKGMLDEFYWGKKQAGKTRIHRFLVEIPSKTRR